MSIIPVMRCNSLRESIKFYTEILDFVRVGGGDDDPDECSVAWLQRGNDELILANEDGEYGTVVVVMTENVDAEFDWFRKRGLKTPGDPNAPKQVHEGPTDQTWGTREFYVEDPDGNTLRFTQLARSMK